MSFSNALLTLFFTVFPIDPPENIRKPNIPYPLIRRSSEILGLLMFSGESKRNIDKAYSEPKQTYKMKLFVQKTPS